MITNTNQKLFSFIKASPTPYHAVDTVSKRLDSEGFTKLSESDQWKLEKGCGYYVTRGGSSLIAFRVPENFEHGFMISAAHSDSPTFKVKDVPELTDGHTIRLSTEGYGGMIASSWFDRPLAVAGRVIVRDGTRLVCHLIDTEVPCAVIPNVAIHMNRKVNDGYSYNTAVDTIPLFASSVSGDFKKLIADKAGVSEESIVSHDFSLYCAENGIEWGEYISAPRLDDLQCAFASLEAFVEAEVRSSSPVYCLFDNEEVGSLTKQGADSTFLRDTLERICESLGCDIKRKCAESFLVSCDNAHACHPNHPELSDKNHAVYMNGGIAIKFNANQKYTSDGVSIGIFRTLCDAVGAKTQLYANRADMPGGSTLGNISNAHVSLWSVDIGLPQLAMHSAYETAGKDDTAHLISALKTAFSKSLILIGDGEYSVE